jgi:hypothetical protein
MDIVERLAQQAAETINGGEFNDGKWYTEGQRQAWRKAMTPAADEIERLREENKRLRESNQHKTMQSRLNGRTVILHQSGDVWVPHWQEEPEVLGEKE